MAAFVGRHLQRGLRLNEAPAPRGNTKFDGALLGKSVRGESQCRRPAPAALAPYRRALRDSTARYDRSARYECGHHSLASR